MQSHINAYVIFFQKKRRIGKNYRNILREVQGNAET